MSAQRMQQNAQMNDFPGQSQFPSRAEGRQQWDTNPQNEMNPMSPHSYSHGHKGNASQSQERMSNQRANHENRANNDPRFQSYEQDMEIGYEDSESIIQGMEQRFQDEIMKLIKELGNSEDAENARHKERIVDINTRYQEKLSSLRAQHTSRIGEFLHKESQTRLHHYKQTAMTERGPTDTRDYGWAMGPGPDARRPYGTMPDEPYREHPRYYEAMRSQSSELRVPYPHGRDYNNSGARY
ncbi:hypothetical protein L1887_09669 [Cichorium endivia]|nr:hypothetical protein L1887_09669 [Cichorium endivia]